MPLSRWTVLLGLAALSLLSFAAPTSACTPQENPERVIVIGVDGGDGRTVEEMMDRGELPNMQRLREMGTFARLGTALPAESPTAWASLNTGRNPGETEVPGFIRRNFDNRGLPVAGFGHIIRDDVRQLGELPNRPIWARADPNTWRIYGFTGAFLVFLFAFKLLLRMRAMPAVVLASLFGVVGAWAGGSMRGHYVESYTRTANPMSARNFWDIAGDAGVKSIVLDSAQSFDKESPAGVNVLHGLGVPDLRGGIGDWQIYTTESKYLSSPPQFTRSSSAGQIYKINARRGVVDTTYYGPRNFARKEQLTNELADLEAALTDVTIGYKASVARRKELTPRIDEIKALIGQTDDGVVDSAVVHGIPMPLHIEPTEGGKYTVSFGDQSQDLEVGGWSDYYHLSFELTPMMKLHGITRAKLISVEPELKLFVNTLDIAPEKQPFWQEVTAPASFGAELASSGSFETYGWACMTMPFKDGQISPELLLEDIEFTFKWRERLFFEQIQRGDFSLFMGVFSTPDRVQHMTYQYYDETHPMHDPEVANREVVFFGEAIKLKEAVPAIFRQVDRVVGRVLDEVLRPTDELMMCADHGFQSFHHQVRLNNLLAELGFLHLKPGVKASESKELRYVDWSKTRAYALGLGTIFLNLQGRERQGIVRLEDVDATLAELREALLGYVDPATGEPVLDEVYRISEIHSGEFVKHEADLITGFHPTYRVSWGTTAGGIGLEDTDDGVILQSVVTDNTSPWSGGHPSVNADAVRGLFFSSRALELPEGGPNLLHIAPTVLSMLGVPIPEEMDLPPLLPAQD